MNVAAAFRGKFDATFPDLKPLPRGADRVPGRQLGELVVVGLRQRGFATSDLKDNEPFFVTECQSGEHTYPIQACLAYFDNSGPAWVVFCSWTIGFWGRLWGRTEDTGLMMVLEAVHEVLKKDDRISDIRWFPEFPHDPFSKKKYGLSPSSQAIHCC